MENTMKGITNSGSGGGGSSDIIIITASSGANGSISPAGDVQVIKGDDKTFTFTPNTGYGIDDVLVDGSSVGRVGTYTFTNVRAAHTIRVTFRTLPVYTVIRQKNQSATTVDVSCTDPSADLSTQTSRENIVKTFVRHCLVKRNIESVKYVKEDNFAEYLDGTPAVLTGADGDFVMEFDQYWSTCTDKSTYWEIKFATFKFDDNAVTPHRFGGTLRSHRYIGVFNGYNDTWLRSIATSNVPSNSQNIDWFSAQAKNGGSGMSTNTYGIENVLDWMMLITLHMFVYKTTHMQGIVCGLNKGSGSGASDLQGCNAGFSATGGWTQGTTANYTTCCMTLGIMNVYGKQWQFIGNCIFNGGNWKFATDPADYYNVASGTYAGAPSAWTVVAAGTPTNMSQSYITEICGNNVAPYLPKAASGGSASTYYCDAAWSATGDRCCFVGAAVYIASGVAGVFAVDVDSAVSASYWLIGARLAFSSLD